MYVGNFGRPKIEIANKGRCSNVYPCIIHDMRVCSCLWFIQAVLFPGFISRSAEVQIFYSLTDRFTSQFIYDAKLNPKCIWQPGLNLTVAFCWTHWRVSNSEKDVWTDNGRARIKQNQKRTTPGFVAIVKPSKGIATVYKGEKPNLFLWRATFFPVTIFRTCCSIQTYTN